jgi:RNA polymerase sigma-70 factor (ECF subfamily)
MVNAVDGWLKAAKRGSRPDFDRLIEYYSPRVYNFIRQHVPNQEDAADITQETFFRVYRHFDQYDMGQRFEPWLFSIANHLVIDYSRRKRPTVSLDEPLDDSGDMFLDPPDPAESTEDQIEHEDLMKRVTKLVQDLDEQYRSILVLRFVEHLAYEDIAAITDLPVSTVRTRLYRARMQLRDKLVAEGYLDERRS